MGLPIVAGVERLGDFPMHRFIAVAIAVAMTSLFALIFWQASMKVTDAAIAQFEPDYAVTSGPYLPIQTLEPFY
jgi:hypothetical protein